MAAADKIKNLIRAFGEGDEVDFFATAMQIAASEARKGHQNFAKELKKIIEKAKTEYSQRSLTGVNNTVPISHTKRELRELIEVLQPSIKLSDMVLDKKVKTSLTRMIEEQYKWGLLRKHNLFPRRKLLLTGSPGTGKTMTAQAIAGELGLLVYIIRLDGLISKYMGESIAKLRLIFDTMQDNRAVYLFDEFDSIGSNRNLGTDVGEIKRVLNSFLVNIEKDRSNSIIIAATNIPEILDEALFRRFDDIIQYPLPIGDDITNIIKKYTQRFSFTKRPSYNNLKKIAQGLSFSDIVKSCEDAIKKMIIEGQEKLDYDFLKECLKNRNTLYGGEKTHKTK